MSINKKDYKRVETHLFIHKSYPNTFLFRKVFARKYYNKVVHLELREGWGKREYKGEAKRLLLDWIEGKKKEIKGTKFKDATKVNELFELWQAKKDTNKKSVKSDIAFYENYLQDELGNERATDVIAERIDNIIHNLMHVGKYNKATGKTHILSKRTAYDNTRRILGEIFDIAVRNQLIIINPCNMLTKLASNTKKSIVKNPTQKFIILKNAILELYKDDPFWRAFFLFCLYGRRKSEVIGLSWENIDLEQDVYYLIDTKNGNDYKKPLPRLVKEAILQIPDEQAGLVFKSQVTGGELKNTDRQKTKIDKFVGFDDFKLHSTRHISASALEELGASSQIIKDHLTHRRDGVTYQHYVTYDTYLNSLKALQMLEKISNKID